MVCLDVILFTLEFQIGQTPAHFKPLNAARKHHFHLLRLMRNVPEVIQSQRYRKTIMESVIHYEKVHDILSLELLLLEVRALREITCFQFMDRRNVWIARKIFEEAALEGSVRVCRLLQEHLSIDMYASMAKEIVSYVDLELSLSYEDRAKLQGRVPPNLSEVKTYLDGIVSTLSRRRESEDNQKRRKRKR